jgi:hypothetical protein
MTGILRNEKGFVDSVSSLAYILVFGLVLSIGIGLYGIIWGGSGTTAQKPGENGKVQTQTKAPDAPKAGQQVKATTTFKPGDKVPVTVDGEVVVPNRPASTPSVPAQSKAEVDLRVAAR